MSNDNEDGGNVIQFGQIKGDKPQEERLPTADYTVEDIDHNLFHEHGFCIFTTSHIAIMKETPQGATPVLIVPLHRTLAAYIDEDDRVTTELPF